ncbi:MAG: ABC transporter permease [Candidatus Rokubacteria bacterium]|nr:ABC transporter permease [Candidatus Rokubacteria bacterium]MBI3104805.1 ABC transporter permease [Candidatus Rokubacteria bacterium]
MPSLLSLFNGAVYAFLLAPIVLVLVASLTSAGYVSFPPVGLSLRWYAEIGRRHEFVDALMVSLTVAAAVSVVSTVLGVLAALGLVRYRFLGRDLLNALFLSPLMLPGIVIAVAVLQFYARAGVAATPLTLVLGHVIITTPYTVRLAAASLAGFDRSLERAARNLGASPLQTFRRITLPIIAPGVIAGAMFAFIVSFDDVNVALFLSSPQTTTLPVLMFSYSSQETSPILTSASAVLILVVAALVLVIDRLIGVRNVLGAE